MNLEVSAQGQFGSSDGLPVLPINSITDIGAWVPIASYSGPDDVLLEKCFLSQCMVLTVSLRSNLGLVQVPQDMKDNGNRPIYSPIRLVHPVFTKALQRTEIFKTIHD